MLIDIHNHLGYSDDGGEAPLESILDNMKTFRIDKLVLFAIDEKDSGATFENSNQRIIDACHQYPQKIIPFARILPSAGPKALDEFKRCLGLGVKGLKLKTKDGFKPEEAIPIFEVIKENPKFPVIIHVEHEEGSQPSLWEPVIQKYPVIKFIMAHGAKDQYRMCAKMVKKYPNIYIDTTTLSYNRTKYLYCELGADRILFGSDFPYSHPAIELAKFDVIVTSHDDKEKIYYKNALHVLDL